MTLPDSANAFSGNIALDELFGVTGGLTYTAVSSAPDVVSVAVNGNVLTVTGLKMGNASGDGDGNRYRRSIRYADGRGDGDGESRRRYRPADTRRKHQPLSQSGR